MTMINLKKISFLFIPFILAACTNSPTHLIITPDIQITNKLQYIDKHINLNIIDMRTSNFIVQILRKDKAATLLSAQEQLNTIIEKSLFSQWKKQGITFSQSNSSYSGNTIKVSIRKALVSVHQEILRYKSHTEIVIDVTINSGNQTLTSTFKNKSNSEGPLQADIAELERDFNQNLGAVLKQILNSSDINHFINQDTLAE